MSRWFRHYAGMMRDEKLVRVALRAKQSIERVMWVWGAILESAAEINDGGRYDFDADEAAYFLRADETDIHAIEASLMDCGRVSEGRVAKWGDRQFKSDDSAERVRRHRLKQRGDDSGGDERKPEHSVGYGIEDVTLRNAPETETEEDTEKKDSRTVARATRPQSNAAFDEFWKAYPKREGENPKQPARKKFEALVKSGVDPGEIIAGAKKYAANLRSAGQERTKFVAQAATWLGQQRYADYGDAEPAADIQLQGFYASFGSPQLDAWEAHDRATGRRRARDKHGGWTFPTEWPPGYEKQGDVSGFANAPLLARTG
jgi:hypothetical protein